MLLPVIMAGGTGTRLWPLSRAMSPKQFLPLTGELTMLQATLTRLEGIEHASPMVLTNENHRYIVAEQMRALGVEPSSIILEPIGRNTAPAIALAALEATQKGEDPLLLVLAADHIIQDVPAFHAAIRQAIIGAEQGDLVTFGIVPTEAATGYGYIQAKGSGSPRSVDSFQEKPDQATAEIYLASGEHFWNSGMFLFRASRYLEELRQSRPDILSVCEQAMIGATSSDVFLRIPADDFSACPSDSIDYAVMEKSQRVVMVLLNADWSDIGSWSALWEVDEKCGNGNAVRGDVILEDTKDSLIHATSRLVATVGLEQIIVVETRDAVLVAHKEKAQQVKSIVDQLKQHERTEANLHREVYRPWGKYDAIDNGERYQAKRILVKPGAKISLQMHHHRAEHWIVVKGTAKITRGQEEFLLSENQSTYIPLGEVHCLENPGKIDLEIIEVQSGSYLGEDDIVRFEDVYGRC